MPIDPSQLPPELVQRIQALMGGGGGAQPMPLPRSPMGNGSAQPMPLPPGNPGSAQPMPMQRGPGVGAGSGMSPGPMQTAAPDNPNGGIDPRRARLLRALMARMQGGGAVGGAPQPQMPGTGM